MYSALELLDWNRGRVKYQMQRQQTLLDNQLHIAVYITINLEKRVRRLFANDLTIHLDENAQGL